MGHVLGCLLIVLVSLQPVDALAYQSTTDSPSEEPVAASDLLPKPLDFGLGWEVAHSYDPAVDDDPELAADLDVFASANGNVYTGPAGARIIVIVWINHETRQAIQDSLTITTAWFDLHRRYLVVNDWVEDVANQADPPHGCAEARRMAGADPVFFIPAGGTMCEINFTVTVLAIVYGSWDGDYRAVASDKVVEMVAKPTLP